MSYVLFRSDFATDTHPWDQSRAMVVVPAGMGPRTFLHVLADEFDAALWAATAGAAALVAAGLAGLTAWAGRLADLHDRPTLPRPAAVRYGIGDNRWYPVKRVSRYAVKTSPWNPRLPTPFRTGFQESRFEFKATFSPCRHGRQHET